MRRGFLKFGFYYVGLSVFGIGFDEKNILRIFGLTFFFFVWVHLILSHVFHLPLFPIFTKKGEHFHILFVCNPPFHLLYFPFHFVPFTQPQLLTNSA